MRFYTIEKDGKRTAAVGYKDCDIIWPVNCFGLEYEDVLELIKKAGEREMASFAKAPEKGGLKEGEYKLCAPIPNPVGDVVCVGVNYHAHLIESAGAGHVSLMDHPDKTVYFSKRVDEAVACGAGIPAHEDICDSLDYEVELGVVIGKNAKKVAREEALDYVFGYTIVNDVSARTLQTDHKQWYRGKSLDGFCPMGPCIVTADEFGDPSGHDICSYLNGQLRQNSNTRLLMRDVPGLIEELSSGMTLKAGTVIASGTPSGVGMGMNPKGYMKVGDVIECKIQGIGSLVNTIVE